MPVHEVKNLNEFFMCAGEANPLGKSVFYIYQDGTVSLHHAYDLISRECPNSKFYTISMDICDDDFNEKYEVFSYPVFLVLKENKVLGNSSVSTKEGLVRLMKRSGVLDEKIDLTNTLQ
ncbi:hypothetical protein AKO1_002602 [Acrasis kona]|uniref:Thioredoxin domain-containing protein n=1 Tax=Acrasis kona TaxID=1008807 RepID=A0AAW2YT51_9EUKA